MFTGKEPFPTIYVESQKEGEVCIIKFISHSLICHLNYLSHLLATCMQKKWIWRIFTLPVMIQLTNKRSPAFNLTTCNPLFLDGQFETDPVIYSSYLMLINEIFLIIFMFCFSSFVSQRWAVISKTQMKNAKKAFNREQMKNDAKDKKEVCVLPFSSLQLLLEQHNTDSLDSPQLNVL